MDEAPYKHASDLGRQSDPDLPEERAESDRLSLEEAVRRTESDLEAEEVVRASTRPGPLLDCSLDDTLDDTREDRFVSALDFLRRASPPRERDAVPPTLRTGNTLPPPPVSPAGAA